MNIDTLFELSVEEKVTRIDKALNQAEAELGALTTRFNDETQELRATIETLVNKRVELVPSSDQPES